MQHPFVIPEAADQRVRAFRLHTAATSLSGVSLPAPSDPALDARTTAYGTVCYIKVHCVEVYRYILSGTINIIIINNNRSDPSSKLMKTKPMTHMSNSAGAASVRDS